MGCVFRLTAILTLATGVHISLASETFAHQISGIPGAVSPETEVFDGYLSNSEQEDGIPEDDRGDGGGARSLRGSSTDQDGIPDAEGDTGSR